MLHTLHSIADWVLKMNPAGNREFIVDSARMVHDQLCRADLWNFRLSEAYITSIADYSTGTVDVTNGSTTLSGGSTVWTAAHEGSHFRTSSGSPDYLIDTFTSTTALELATPFVGSTDTGLSYTIRKKWYGLPWNLDQGEAFYESDGKKIITWRNLLDLELADPDADSQGSVDWIRLAPAREKPAYSTGTVTLTKNSTTLTGSGTTWLAARDRGRPIRFPLHPLGGTFGAIKVNSTTEIILDRQWPFETTTSQLYEIDPAGTRRVEFNPAPNENTQIRIKYYRIMPPLYLEDEFSPLPDHMHDIWLQATILNLSVTDPIEYRAKFATLIEPLRASNHPESHGVVESAAWGMGRSGGSNLPPNFPASRVGRR